MAKKIFAVLTPALQIGGFVASLVVMAIYPDARTIEACFAAHFVGDVFFFYAQLKKGCL